VRVAADPSLGDLKKEFDAVLVAVGQVKDSAETLGLRASPTGIQISRKTFQASADGVFAGGDAVRPSRLSVRAVADGKAAATCIDQYLCGREVAAPERPFSTHMGKLTQAEIEALMTGVSPSPRASAEAAGEGLTRQQAGAEAARCLHCDCRKRDSCKLREYAEAYGARAGRHKGQRRSFEQYADHREVIYEPGKCIACGLCVQIAAAAGEPLGLTFIGRGFNMRVAVPFGKSLADGLTTSAAKCVAACPTGALAFKRDE